MFKVVHVAYSSTGSEMFRGYDFDVIVESIKQSNALVAAV